MPPSRSSMTSDGHERLEPRVLRAVENDDIPALENVLALAHEYGQYSDNFLRTALMRSAERNRVKATEHLLRLGAKTDVANNRATPLLRAVDRDHYEIVRLLLDAGASPNTTDKEGRTALMTAAWKNHADTLQLLITRGADVNARDLRRRNALHNLAADKECRYGWDEGIVRLLLRAGCKVSGLEAQDELGRTPLHWACATGNWRVAELLLTGGGSGNGGARAEIDAVEARGKTALHVATAHDRADIVSLLLKHDAAVQACSDGGWTPLHNACDKGCEEIVRILLRAGAPINSQLLNGVTPLHLAAQGGHREVVECLLERADLKRRVRDNFGSTPFLRAAQFKRRDIVLLLAPFNNVESLSEDVRQASAAFESTVVDFGNFHNENRVKRMSVYNLLYGRDPENPRKQAVTTVPADSRATDFRWIHLPANNMAWVEALLTKSFIEEGAHDVDGFKGLEKSFNYQHRGQKIHSHFMRPLCQNTPRTTMKRQEEKTEDHSTDAQSVFTDNSSVYRKPKGSTAALDESFGSSGKKSKNAQKRGKSGSNPGTPKLESKTKGPWGPGDKARPSPLTGSSASLCKDPYNSISSSCNVCVFMPYLHFETAAGRQKMHDAIQRAGKLNPDQGVKRTRTRDEMLIDAHLSSSTTSLHVRRTLDQFFYPNIDTQSRDQDQVVYRYQTKGPGREGGGTDPKIFMVDQLWVWILGTNLIVTSFPQRWEQPKNDPLNVLDGIIEDINSKTRDPVRNVYDLAIIITNRCSGVFDRHRLGDDEYQFLDMFESSIGIATDRETLLFQRFNHASAQASSWLKSHRRLNKFAQSRKRSGSGRDGTLEEEDYDSDDDYRHGDGSPLFVDDLLDIGEETDLLAETKDIRDELNMIRTVLEHQKHVLVDFQEAIWEIFHGQHRSQYDVKKRFKDQQRMIDMHLKDLDRMDKQAERIYHSITDLLDLKQKHANAFEARFARDQAAGTSRQSKTIMVFTIVTIIFLPLSFITSIFTINMAQFQDLTLSYVSRYTFGIGFAISIPLIVVALSLDDIGDFFRHGRRLISRREPAPAPDRDANLQTLQIEKILSMARSRRSADLDYGPSLLPVSTRGTVASKRSDRLHVNGLAKGLSQSSRS